MSPDTLALAHAQKLAESNRPLFMSEWNRRKKDKGTAIGLSLVWLIGIGGVGRMYAGDIGYGLALLFLGPLTCYIWPLIDTFIIGNSVESHNSQLLMELQASFPPA